AAGRRLAGGAARPSVDGLGVRQGVRRRARVAARAPHPGPPPRGGGGAGGRPPPRRRERRPVPTHARPAATAATASATDRTVGTLAARLTAGAREGWTPTVSVPGGGWSPSNAARCAPGGAVSTAAVETVSAPTNVATERARVATATNRAARCRAGRAGAIISGRARGSPCRRAPCRGSREFGR